MSKAVKFNRYGGTEVLELVEVEDRAPGAGEVRVEVVSAGVNPGESAIRSGALHSQFPASFPEGQGSDFAGVVQEVGSGVDFVSPGDDVFGYTNARNAQAEIITLAAEQVIRKPGAVGYREAGSLFVAGSTAWACVAATGIRRGDTVVIAGGAGGVGVIATQLAVIAGAAVIATASGENHEYLASLGAIPVAYGPGLADRIRRIVPGGVDAFIDTHGDGDVEVARSLGVETKRINTTIDFAAKAKYGVKADGSASVPPRETLIELIRLMANNELVLPIRAAFPLAEVRAAYELVATGHGLGKIVLDVN